MPHYSLFVKVPRISRIQRVNICCMGGGGGGGGGHIIGQLST